MAGEPKYNKALAKRLFDARKHLELRYGREVTLQQIAEGVGRILNDEPPFFTTAGKWMKGQEPSTSRQTWALAKFFDVDPGDLLFGGTQGNRPMPDFPRGKSGLPPKKRRSGLILRYEHEQRMEQQGAAARKTSSGVRRSKRAK
jgi:transcriptional regulator with XRE-family HTH domain